MLSHAVAVERIQPDRLHLTRDTPVRALYNAADSPGGHVVRLRVLQGRLSHHLRGVDGYCVRACAGQDVRPRRELPARSSIRTHKEPAEVLVAVRPIKGGLLPPGAGKGADPDIIGVVGVHHGEVGHGRVVGLEGLGERSRRPGLSSVRGLVHPVLLGAGEQDFTIVRVEGQLRDKKALECAQAAVGRNPLAQGLIVPEDAVAVCCGKELEARRILI